MPVGMADPSQKTDETRVDIGSIGRLADPILLDANSDRSSRPSCNEKQPRYPIATQGGEPATLIRIPDDLDLIGEPVGHCQPPLLNCPAVILRYTSASAVASGMWRK